MSDGTSLLFDLPGFRVVSCKEDDTGISGRVYDPAVRQIGSTPGKSDLKFKAARVNN